MLLFVVVKRTKICSSVGGARTLNRLFEEVVNGVLFAFEEDARKVKLLDERSRPDRAFQPWRPK